MRTTENLYRLQAIDLELDRIRAVTEHSDLESRAQEAEGRVETLRGTLEETAQALRDLARQIRRLELDAQAAREEQHRSENELYSGSARSGKELGHLQQRAERAARQAEAMEVESLERMEQAEALEAQQKELERAVSEAEEEAGRCRLERQMEVEELRARQKELEVERDAVATREPADRLARYERMRRQMPNPIAGVSKGQCGACHVSLSPRTLERVRADDGLVQCEQCGRVLHLL
ncbi:zinc ribbon domain-containing protein [Limnochorda pilosa]|uniref:zinc ribbon domain-containing protein n=1 Tax=Limnochorda pilosa TaxID=1555112 RepID=UPI0011873910|nr:C4-type zinc ribbon domain-containing protein [Limnochorda pilosa]